jgi:HK97 gp10 family phage protein
VFKFEFTGMRSVLDKLFKADRLVYTKSKRNTEASAKRIVARSKQLVTVKTGNLRDHIDYVMRGSYAYVGVAQGPPGEGGVGPEHYWRYVEFGTVHVAPHPFFGPAADSDKYQFVNEMIAIGGELEREV